MLQKNWYVENIKNITPNMQYAPSLSYQYEVNLPSVPQLVQEHHKMPDRKSVILAGFHECFTFRLICKLSHIFFFVTGYYMYIETSSPRQQGDNARLRSPNLPFSGNMCLTFYYHMYGVHMGTLNVNINGTRVFTASGNKDNVWLRTDLDVTHSGMYAVRT